jgi:hypothetical protein
LPAFGWLDTVSTATAQGAGGEGPSVANFDRCRSIQDATARLRCFEEAAKGFTPKPQPGAPEASSGWRLVRTPNPAGGRDAVSIMQTADTAKSDLELAGLMLRCGESNTEVLVVLVRPIPPRAHPKITLNFSGKTAEFTAAVVPPGAALLLPNEATALAAGAWQSAPELSVRVDDEQGAIRGIVSLSGLGAALRRLHANCASP